MIKIEMTFRQMECFHEYLKTCICDSSPKTIDLEKEYFIACHIQEIMGRIFKKMSDTFANGYKSGKTHKIKLDSPEVLSLYKYFNRYELYEFLFPIREQVYKAFQKNNNLLKIIDQNKTPEYYFED